MGQLDYCQNTLRAQEQVIGRNHRRQIDLEAKIDHHLQRITKDLKETTGKVNTVTTQANVLDQCLELFAKRFEVIDRQQAKSFRNLH